jgi:chromosome segregation ATPase
MLNDRVQTLTARLEAEREERAILRDEYAALQAECAALRARAETLGDVIAALHANLEDLRSFRDHAEASSRSVWSRLAPIRSSRALHE